MCPIRVLLVDDHVLVRAGLRLLLEGLPAVTVVAEADDGNEVPRLLSLHRPDLVVMDIAMKKSNGLDVTAQIRVASPLVHVVIVSMHASEEYVLRALRVGASAYLVKESATAELALALAAVMAGQIYLSPAVSRQVVDRYVRRMEHESAAVVALTARQRETLILIAQGHGTKEIAYRLQVSVKTVETHRAQLMAKLEIHNVPGLVRYAIREGLVSAEG